MEKKLKAVILAGGLGTRLAEETELRPKPMVQIGGQPILWHILKHYAHFGIDEFYVALGYLGDEIKRYFVDRQTLSGSMTVNLSGGTIERLDFRCENWKVHLVETGLESMTGGRILRLREHLKGGTFLVTYGDGVADVDVSKLVAFHKLQGRVATVTAVRPPARFGGLVLDGARVVRFSEKPQTGEGWINGGFLVCEPAIFDYLSGDGSILETDALERLADEGKLAAYQHPGFWQCMDTLRDKRLLESLWQSGTAPWKLWK
jgi:glucose-1-phosphate cytidylyltransferase